MLDHNKLNSAVNRIDKCLEYLKTVSDSETMYTSTQYKFSHMLSQAEECEKILTRLLSSDSHQRKSWKHSAIASDLALLERILYDMKETPFEYEEVNTCCELLYEWWHIRFVELRDGFTYNAEFIPEWIYDFILLFGYHMHQGTILKFQDMLEDWFVYLRKTKCNFAIPKDIWNLKKSDYADYFTLEGTILYDCILDHGLYAMCEEQRSGVVKFNCNAVSRIVRERNPDLKKDVGMRLGNKDKYFQLLRFTPSRRV